jgi:starvation-inducible DNA-binding protein
MDAEAALRATAELSPQLAELQDLALKAKHAHWNVVGPNFRSVHLQIDEMTDEYRAWTDTVAERIVALGAQAPGQAKEIAAASAIEALPAGPIADKDVVHIFAELLDGVIKRARERAGRLNEIDLVSQGIVLEVVQGLEKQLWMLRAQEA